MPNPPFYSERRELLCQKVDTPILLMGNGLRPRNLPASHLPFRQDSTFLYFTGCKLPNCALLLESGKTVLFAPPPTDDDPLWHGPVPQLSEVGALLGFRDVRPIEQLQSVVGPIGSSLQSIAVPDLRQNLLLEKITGRCFDYGNINGDDVLIDAIIAMRRTLQAEELEEMRLTARVTGEAHLAAMQSTYPGGHEREVAAAFNHAIARRGLTNAYDSIVTVDGHILHNYRHVNPLEAGQLLLLDGGAESPAGYATDVTRTWPVSGTFTSKQRAAYDAVLEAQDAAISKLHAGVRYRDVHDAAGLVVARFLRDEGLLTISAEDAVENGAYALFFPHGIGHLLGLDVHDLENFGDRAAYAPGRQRRKQFGTGYLRLDLDLEPNMVVTIEPGFYIVPSILAHPELSSRFKDCIGWERLASWEGFGGIRIEDNIRITDGAPEVLTSGIAKEPGVLEELLLSSGRPS
jgi:Xaa-Pro aminopeptidase